MSITFKRFLILFLVIWQLAIPAVGASCFDVIDPGLRLVHGIRPWRTIGSNKILTLREGPELHSGIEYLIKSAKSRLFIEVSGFESSPIVELLGKKALEGVEIIVLMTDFNAHWISEERKQKMARDYAEMTRAGVQIVFHKMSHQNSWGTNQLFSENHRKLIIADNELAYIGSANIREYVDNFDQGVLARGSIVKRVVSEFLIDYELATGKTLPAPYPIPQTDDKSVQILFGSGLKKKVLSEIASAEKSIELVSWVLDDDEVIEALRKRKRERPSLEITVLVSAPHSSSLILGYFSTNLLLNQKAYLRLKKAGIQVRFSGPHLVNKRSIVHAKTLIIDRMKVFTGSSDFTVRSLGSNRELTIFLEDAGIAKDFADPIVREYQAGLVDPGYKKWAIFRQNVIEATGKGLAVGRNQFVPASVVRFGTFDGEFASREENGPYKDNFDYYPVTGRLKDIPDGAIVEGSVGYGGLQPNYIIETEVPAVRMVLDYAASLKALPQVERIKKLVSFLRYRILLDRDKRGNEYMRLMEYYRTRQEDIPIAGYIETQVGVCREYSILLHLALKEAGIPSRFAYGSVSNVFGYSYDHAFVVITDDDGTKYIVDAYSNLLHGRKLDDVVRAEGTKLTDSVAAFANHLNGKVSALLGSKVELVDFPTVWVPIKDRRETRSN